MPSLIHFKSLLFSLYYGMWTCSSAKWTRSDSALTKCETLSLISSHETSQKLLALTCLQKRNEQDTERSNPNSLCICALFPSHFSLPESLLTNWWVALHATRNQHTLHLPGQVTSDYIVPPYPHGMCSKTPVDAKTPSRWGRYQTLYILCFSYTNIPW